jgi:error-prone DNA polymerase
MPEILVKPKPSLDEERLPPILHDGPQVLPDYAELHCLSNFSFQRGASHPQELVQRAHELGYAALAITDECSVAGVVRAHSEAKKLGLKLLLGAEFALDGFRLVALARNATGWGNLCEFISAARMQADKGEYTCSRMGSDFTLLAGCEILLVFDHALEFEALCERVDWAQACFPRQLWIAAELLLEGDDDLWLQTLQQVSDATGAPLVAAGDVHMHARSRKPLQDVITAVRGQAGGRVRLRTAGECRAAPAPSHAAGFGSIRPNCWTARWR